MNTLTDKMLFLLYSLGSCMFFVPDSTFAAFFLLAAAISSFHYALKDFPYRFLFLIVYGCAAIFFPESICFLPLLFYDLMSLFSFTISGLWIFLPAAALFVFHLGSLPFPLPVYLAMGMLFGVFLFLRTRSLQQLSDTYKKVRDDQMEDNLSLAEKNRALLEKQDYEIYTATLKERNRIAREIHDHVGHMLSRSILMVGALKAVSKEQSLKVPLDQLGDTLNTAMDNIRESVHDLHDESVNLKEAVNSLLADFHYCPVSLEYDMSYELPAPVKYCFLSIIKEGLSNIAKHSQATKAQITLREHPGMYQLILQDNGKGKKETEKSHGIGLVNMEERVSLLHGTIGFHQEKGFRIFITVPKEKSKKGETLL